MYKKYDKCNCQNKEVINEMILQDTENIDDQYECMSKMEKLECGFNQTENYFPNNVSLAQSYVPYQKMDKTFVPCVGLKMGTIFPELVSPYVPCQAMMQNEFLRTRNSMKAGDNTCF